ncbi:MAG: nitric oxide synthase [Sphaerobacteraceae bacterium]|nr:MAG: nitric oxide synthase [Sphaerobacteraceae bacterium]
MYRTQYQSASLFEEARDFIIQCYGELGKHDDIDQRIESIKCEIDATGQYIHTHDELEHGARMAWRNSNRCIGRMPWRSLTLRDCRHISPAEEIAQALVDHLDAAFNGGRIRPTITVLPPGVRILNHQLIRYAGYLQQDGSIVGDPDSLEFTRQCQEFGWQGEGTAFDILPWLIQLPGKCPELFPVPADAVYEVPIIHPDIEWFDELGLRWYAVPVISDMELEIGGVTWTGAPFNGWYMQTEIAARNLADKTRYNILPEIARRMRLDTSRSASLWKDRALLELNVALLYSFEHHGIRIVDHHSADRQFSRFMASEKRAGRTVTGDWIWLTPPMAPATTDTFSRRYRREVRSPNFFYRERAGYRTGTCPITSERNERPREETARSG